MRWLSLPALLLVAAAPTEVLTIGGEAYRHADILDARTISDGRSPVILVTLGDAAAARFQKVTRANVGKPIKFMLATRQLMAPVIAEPVTGNSFQIPVQGTFAEAAALALKISGKPPLPETDGE